MIARTESRVACCTSSSERMVAPLVDFSFSLDSMCFSTVLQSPSSAEISSPFSTIGQLSRFQVAPSAALRAASASSLSAEKKLCHSSDTEEGSS